MKKSIFKRIGLIALAVCVAIGSFFVPLKSDKKLNAAHADNVVSSFTYNGSNFFIPIFRTSNLTNYNIDTLLYKVSFTTDTDNITLNFSGSRDYISLNKATYNYTMVNLWTDNNGTTQSYTINKSSLSGLFYLYAFHNSVGYQYTINYELSSSDFIADIYSISFGHTPYNNLYYNYVKYVDVNDNSLIFYFINYEGANSVNMLNFRTYYILSIDDFSDNQIYNQGYQQGLADNQQNIYNNGYNAGYDVGFGQGRQDGIVEANDYSFISLIGAVVDVPVQTIRGMLNFTFLGINLFDFLMGLIAILVILFIVKLVRGG